MNHPTISSIMLRPLESSDSDALFRWINDRDTVVLNGPFEPVARTDHNRWFDAIRQDPDVRIFAIVECATQRLVGTCQLLNIAKRHHSATLQIRIGEPDARGRGLGTQAVRQLIKIGFGEMGLHRIALTVRVDNERAIRTYRSCGFEEEGVAREAAWIEGRFVDLLCMAKLAG